MDTNDFLEDPLDFKGEDDDYTPEEDLMSSLEVGFRMIVLKDPGRTQVVGIINGESDDSILIYFPSVYIVDPKENTVELDLFLQSSSYVRFFKSDLALMIPFPRQLEKVYKTFLYDHVRPAFPEKWEELREQIDIDIPTRRAIIEEPEGGLEAYLEKAGEDFRTPPASTQLQ